MTVTAKATATVMVTVTVTFSDSFSSTQLAKLFWAREGSQPASPRKRCRPTVENPTMLYDKGFRLGCQSDLKI